MGEHLTLRLLRRRSRELFHPNQDWFDDEPFMDMPHKVGELGMPTEIVTTATPLTSNLPVIQPAVVLAELYVREPGAAIWERYLWTSDRDRQGQRVYLGDNGMGLEIHRHLHLDERWGVPLWLS